MVEKRITLPCQSQVQEAPTDERTGTGGAYKRRVLASPIGGLANLALIGPLIWMLDG